MTATSERDSPSLLLLLAIIGYLLLIAYGSLSPFSGWDGQRFQLARLVAEFWPTYFTFADFVTNFVAYVPLGFLLTLAWLHRTSFWRAISYAAITASSLSLSMELLQLMLPERITSLFDSFLNVSGAIAGAIAAALFSRHSFTGQWLRKIYKNYFEVSPASAVGLSALAIWLLSVTVPILPTLLYSLYKHNPPEIGLNLVIREFQLVTAGVIGLQILALGLVASTLPQRRFLSTIAFTIIATTLILLRASIQTGTLSISSLGGAAIGVLGIALLVGLAKRPKLTFAAMFMVVGYALKQSQTGPLLSDSLYAFNWIPFKGQTDLRGIINFLDEAWIFVAMAYCAAATWRGRSLLLPTLAGIIAIGFLAFSLEWKQQYMAGRYPDITDVLVVVGAWLSAWLYLRLGKSSAHITAREAVKSGAVASRFGRSTAAQIGIIFLVAGAVWYSKPSGPAPTIESSIPRNYPAPSELAPVSLPDFHYEHPRLPSPTLDEIAQLKRENPDFFSNHRQWAQNGKLYSQILMAYVEPGSQNLNALLQQLLALRVTYRGQDEVQPLALAYDWLYQYWNNEQRAMLRDKVIKGCQYEIGLIREEKLSPYNVFLYNAPFQALMACAIAVYDDRPDSDTIMRFTYDLWKRRTLPVWQQIMGKNGGWHEGGEYVGIGIGDAIYQMPAMWRKATGEDLFKTEPGLRGFLDYIVYRTRPDKTDFRWGDAGFFDKHIPDLLPLALEFGHKAAYNLRGAPRQPTPVGWPWGPLTDNRLIDPAALDAMPLTYHADGIGLVVMRSDWSPDATYITFKAGDNYWSHSHLDQGAFTIYKGGELAIDSGLYYEYGTDNHMNYTYQSIAHNLVTVTDPTDTVAMPSDNPNKEGRRIANDGGQRRIGSGWGIEPAPLNLMEWQSKREIYHTATLEDLREEGPVTFIQADLTPAYTNKLSGTGTFSHRTRRVENYKRLFAYDRATDIIVVCDLVTATKPEFRKRWLLHSQEQPVITQNGFALKMSPNERRGHRGGLLEAQILSPQNYVTNIIGGKGFEFWIGNRNYDDNRDLAAEINRRRPLAEPGHWRIEISPNQSQTTDVFLTVLRPRLFDQSTTDFKVQVLEQSNEQIIFEATANGKTRRWSIDINAKNQSIAAKIQ